MKSLSLVLIAFMISINSHEAFAISVRIFTPQTMKRVMGPYPTVGSAAEILDFDILRNYQATRTEAECVDASLEESANITTFFAGKNGPLTKSEAKKLNVRFLKVYAEVGANIYVAKKTFKRPRPYIYNSEIVPCIDLENSYAYPSGHTTLARVLAKLLSRIYPTRAEAFMKRAEEAGTNRILGGVHHPSDIEAGKKFADFLLKELKL